MAFGIEVELDGVAVVKASFIESGDVNVTQVADAEGVATARLVPGNDEARGCREGAQWGVGIGREVNGPCLRVPVGS